MKTLDYWLGNCLVTLGYAVLGLLDNVRSSAVQAAAAAASSMGAAEQAQIVRRLREVMGTNPTHATRIREIASQAGLTIR